MVVLVAERGRGGSDGDWFRRRWCSCCCGCCFCSCWYIPVLLPLLLLLPLVLMALGLLLPLLHSLQLQLLLPLLMLLLELLRKQRPDSAVLQVFFVAVLVHLTTEALFLGREGTRGTDKPKKWHTGASFILNKTKKKTQLTLLYLTNTKTKSKIVPDAPLLECCLTLEKGPWRLGGCYVQK